MVDVEGEELLEHVGAGPDRWRQKGIDDNGLAVEAKEAALGLQLRECQSPVEGAFQRDSRQVGSPVG